MSAGIFSILSDPSTSFVGVQKVLYIAGKISTSSNTHLIAQFVVLPAVSLPVPGGTAPFAIFC